MTYVRRLAIPVPTDGASAADVLSQRTANGLLHAVGFAPSTANPWSTNIDFTLTVENGPDILHVDLNASLGEQMFWPRRTAHTTSSGAFDPAGNTSGREAAMIPLGDQRVRVVAASGGATTSGVVNLYLA